SDRLRFTVLASPNRPATDPVIIDMLSAKSIQDLNERASRHFLDVSPPTDSRPFFFNQLRFTQPSDLFFALRGWRDGHQVDTGSVWSGNLLAVATLFLGILPSALVAFQVLGFPCPAALLA